MASRVGSCARTKNESPLTTHETPGVSGWLPPGKAKDPRRDGGPLSVLVTSGTVDGAADNQISTEPFSQKPPRGRVQPRWSSVVAHVAGPVLCTLVEALGLCVGE